MLKHQPKGPNISGNRTFCHSGQFAPSFGRFAPWMIRHLGGLLPAQFAPRRFTTWMICHQTMDNLPPSSNNHKNLSEEQQVLLTVPRTNLTISQRAFCHSSPSICNSIPLSAREAPSIGTFKHRLKSFYFNSLIS